LRVRDLMSSPVLTVSPETPLRDVARSLSESRISGAPVVSDEGRVLGVISESDIVEKERGCDGPLAWWRPDPRARRRKALAGSVTATDAMQSPAVVVDAAASDYHAAWLMSEHDVNRLPVLEHGKLVGVVSRADLTREFARPDASIARDVQSQVIEPLLVLDVAVEVREGHVTLRGVVERDCDRECLPHAVSQVPGVVSVESEVVVGPAP